MVSSSHVRSINACSERLETVILSAVLGEYEASSLNFTEVKILIKFLRRGEYLGPRKRR
jgi:hypothetical protein